MIPYHNSARLIWRTVHDFIILIPVLYGHEPRKFDILLHVFECFCFWQRHHITVNLWSACGAAGSSSCTRDLASCSSSCLSLRPNWASATMEVTYLEPEAPSTASGQTCLLHFCRPYGAPFQKGSLSSPNCLLFEFRNLCLQVFCDFLGHKQ